MSEVGDMWDKEWFDKIRKYLVLQILQRMDDIDVGIAVRDIIPEYIDDFVDIEIKRIIEKIEEDIIIDLMIERDIAVVIQERSYGFYIVKSKILYTSLYKDLNI